MEFKNTQSYRCFKSVCLWSLIFNLAIVLCFFIGYILTCIVGLIAGADFAQGFGWLAIVAPTILTAIAAIICFMVSCGYFGFVLYLECRKAENLPMAIVDKTEQVFNTLVKNEVLKNIIIFISVISFVFSMLMSVMNIFAILVGLLSFGVLFLIYSSRK